MMRETIIDCDIHCTVPSIRALFPYLSDYWIETIEQAGQRATDNYYPSGAASPPGGTAAGERPRRPRISNWCEARHSIGRTSSWRS